MATDRQPGRPRAERPLLVGRDRERARLDDLLSSTLSGVGNLALISGEAGIGKTTLVQDVAQQARERGVLVLSGGCYDLMITPLYGPWSEVLQGYRPGTEQPPMPAWFENTGELENAGSQAMLLENVRRFIAELCEHTVLAIILEDVHWADAASLDLLRFVTRGLTDIRLLLIVTYRDDDLSREHALYRILPTLIREAPTNRIDLHRLDVVAVGEMIAVRYALGGADHARLVDHVQRLAEGNPFFVSELLRSLEEERALQQVGDGDSWVLDDVRRIQVPPLLRQVIDRRLTRLHEEARNALETAAVIGYNVPIELWQMTSGLSVDALDDAIRQALAAHVLQETPDAAGLRFTHALVREALHDGIILTRRRARHRMIAETLTTMPQPDPDVVAYHFQQAGDQRALSWLARAGLRAWHASAWITAASRFESAAAMLDSDEARARECGWLLYMAATLRRYTDNRQTLMLLQQAEGLAELSGDAVLAADVRWHRGITRTHTDDMRLGLVDLAQGDEALDRLAREQFVLSEEDLAEQVIRSLLSGEQTSSVDDDTSTAALSRHPSPALIQRGVLVNQLGLVGRYQEALALGEVWAVTMDADFGREHLRNVCSLDGHLGLGRAYAMLGRPADAPRELHLARTAALEMDDYFGVSFCILNELQFVVIPYFADDVRMRAQLVKRATQDADHLKHVMEGTTHDRLCKMVVDFVEARWDHVDAPELDVEQLTHHPMISNARVMHGVVARHRGRTDRAWEQIAAVLPDGASTDPGDCYFYLANQAQRLAIALLLDERELDSALTWLAAHDRWLAWSGAVVGRAEGQLLWSRYHQLAGNPEQARQHVTQAVEHASEPRQPLVLLAAERMLGELFTEDRRFVEAENSLRRSLALAEACAAPFEQALTLLALAGLGAVTGKVDEAWQRIDQVRAICTPLGALPTLQRATAVAAKLAVRRGRPVHPAGLTPREAEILGRIAVGKSNSEVADELFLSVRTVERHVTNIYNKLGVSTRVEATRFALEQGLARSSSP